MKPRKRIIPLEPDSDSESKPSTSTNLIGEKRSKIIKKSRKFSHQGEYLNESSKNEIEIPCNSCKKSFIEKTILKHISKNEDCKSFYGEKFNEMKKEQKRKKMRNHRKIMSKKKKRERLENQRKYDQNPEQKEKKTI